jgi:hypothetical protein
VREPGVTWGRLAATVPVRFERHGAKFCARTPHGELAYSDAQGLYEWRGGQRIHYSGGDRQASGGGGWYRHSDLPDLSFTRGLEALMSQASLS